MARLLGIEQVNQAIANIDQITQQNAALVEEATAAARNLEEQSDTPVAGLRNAPRRVPGDDHDDACVERGML